MEQIQNGLVPQPRQPGGYKPEEALEILALADGSMDRLTSQFTEALEAEDWPKMHKISLQMASQIHNMKGVISYTVGKRGFGGITTSVFKVDEHGNVLAGFGEDE